MPPYSIPLHIDCDAEGCNRGATYTVFGSRNEKVGNYCSQHTQERIADLNYATKLKTKLETEARHVRQT